MNIILLMSLSLLLIVSCASMDYKAAGLNGREYAMMKAAKSKDNYPYKLGQFTGEDWIEYEYPAVYERERLKGGVERIVAGFPKGGLPLFLSLVDCLEPPFHILYVLHTPRGEGEPGRYQSPKLGRDEVQAFFKGFADYLLNDARFDIWVYSITERATLVWDQHNLIYAYGSLDRFISILQEYGFTYKETRIPCPHQHNYRAEYDNQAAAVLSAFDWTRTPLEPEDEQ
jgi:hypothetical protein